MITDINSEDRLVQQTFAEYLHDVLGWESVYAWNQEIFGPHGMLGRDSEREVVLVRDLRAALARLNLPGGNIRSIAVNAAFKAADAGTRIEQSLLATTAHEEFAKLERSMGSAAMGGMA